MQLNSRNMDSISFNWQAEHHQALLLATFLECADLETQRMSSLVKHFMALD